jgi:hypothetical protein
MSDLDLEPLGPVAKSPGIHATVLETTSGLEWQIHIPQSEQRFVVAFPRNLHPHDISFILRSLANHYDAMNARVVTAN